MPSKGLLPFQFEILKKTYTFHAEDQGTAQKIADAWAKRLGPTEAKLVKKK